MTGRRGHPGTTPPPSERKITSGSRTRINSSNVSPEEAARNAEQLQRVGPGSGCEVRRMVAYVRSGSRHELPAGGLAATDHL